MSSKFTWWVLLPAFVSIILFITIFITANKGLIFFSLDTPLFFKMFFIIFFIYLLIMLISGELRIKAIKIIINDSYLVKRGFIGVGIRKTYFFDRLDGYKTSIISSRSGSYEYLYIMKGNKKVVKLSEFYHSNYKDLKRELIKKGIRNLGVENWNLLRETKELFT